MVRARWIQVSVIILAVGMLATPLVLLVLRQPRARTLLPSIPQTTDNRYSAKSEIFGYSIDLVDTRYLDYHTANLNIFRPNAVIEPGFYFGQRLTAKRQSVNRIRFVLVNAVDRPITTILNSSADPKSLKVIATGDYDVDGDTLIVRTAVRFDALNTPFTKKFAWEDAFLRSSLMTLYYALGDTSQQNEKQMVERIQSDMNTNLYTGLFPWPFRISQR